MDGMRIDRIEYDEGVALNATAILPQPLGDRRELITVRPDGSTYSLAFPADWDLGRVVPDGHCIGFDAGGP